MFEKVLWLGWKVTFNSISLLCMLISVCGTNIYLIALVTIHFHWPHAFFHRGWYVNYKIIVPIIGTIVRLPLVVTFFRNLHSFSNQFLSFVDSFENKLFFLCSRSWNSSYELDK